MYFILNTIEIEDCQTNSKLLSGSRQCCVPSEGELPCPNDVAVMRLTWPPPQLTAQGATLDTMELALD